MRKLLYIDPIRLPTEKAHGIQIMEMCAAFRRNKVDVELVVSDRRTAIEADPFDYYALNERFPIARLRAPDLVEYGPIGFRVFLVVFTIRALWYARTVKPDFVYTRTPAIARAFSLFYRDKVVWEVHARHVVPRSVLHSVGLIVAITRSLAAWYISQGAASDRVHIAPDGVNLNAFAVVDHVAARRALRIRMGLESERPVALYLGSFGVYAWKGVSVAREAARFAPEVIWLFVGGSEKECADLLQDAPQNVRTLPRAGRREIAALICAADALLLPNIGGSIESERDTSPLKLFEYMASDVPIVASDLPSTREILSETTAFLVPAGDPQALAEVVSLALQHPDEAHARARAARDVVERYTWDERAARILDRERNV